MKTCKYIALAAMALSFVACEKDNDFQGASDPDAVKINAIIGALQTRVAYGENGTTSFEANDQIRVENTLRSSKNVATYTMGTDYKWTTTDAFVWNGSSKNKFQAYYPVKDYASFESFTIPTNQTTVEKLALADWMTVETEEIDKPENGVLDLNFQHRLAKVTVVVTKFSSQFAGTPTMSYAAFYSQEVDGEITAPQAIGAYLATNAEGKPTATAIVCPGYYVSGHDLMTIDVLDGDGITTELDVPVNDFLVNIGLQAGMHYTFSLTVGKAAVEINSVEVNEWSTQNVNGGTAEELMTETFIEGTTATIAVYGGATEDDVDTAVANALAETPATLVVKGDLSAEQVEALASAIKDWYLADETRSRRIELDMPDVTTLPTRAFYANTALTSVSAASLTDMVNGAFYMCTNLTEIYAPKVQSIGVNALSQTALVSVEFPVATLVANEAFYKTTTLVSAILPKVTEVRDNAFRDCTSLTTLTFGEPIVTLERLSFKGIPSENITLTVSSEQKAFEGSENTSAGWTITDQNVTSGEGQQFLGKTFKEIKFAE